MNEIQFGPKFFTNRISRRFTFFSVSEKSREGFTLIELLVVIAIIGVLVSIVVVAIDPVALIGRSNDTKDRSDAQQLKNALQLYFNDETSYPPDDGTWHTVLETGGYMRDVDEARFTYALIAVGPASGEYRVGVALDEPTAADANTLAVCSAGVNDPAWWGNGSVQYGVCPD